MTIRLSLTSTSGRSLWLILHLLVIIERLVLRLVRVERLVAKLLIIMMLVVVIVTALSLLILERLIRIVVVQPLIVVGWWSLMILSWFEGLSLTSTYRLIFDLRGATTLDTLVKFSMLAIHVLLVEN